MIHFRHGTPAELLEHYSAQAVKGEIVILISPFVGQSAAMEYNLESTLRRYLVEVPRSVKDAAARVSAESGRSRREVYAISLAVKASTKLP